MGTTRFVGNDALWREILACVAKPGKKLVAVAYLGTNGADLLPLGKDDRLVVDMSLRTVRQGGTDPREIRKLVRRGVEVFTRGRLHAKFIIAGKTLIASSANVSSNSQNGLDEAGIITTDAVAIRRAQEFFERLCTEPVRSKYLEQCIKEYRPPSSNGDASPKKRHTRQARVVQAKLWFLGGLRNLNLSETDLESIGKVEARAEKELRNPEKTSVTWVRYWRRPKFMGQIRTGDWIVECMKDGGPRYVTAPAQVLGQEDWKSSKGTTYRLLLLETPDAGEDLRLAAFRKKVRKFEPALDKESPRTRAIENDEHADRILRLWTPSGRISKQR